eukprot:4869959-Pyramimonas_sp.AAC.1
MKVRSTLAATAMRCRMRGVRHPSVARRRRIRRRARTTLKELEVDIVLTSILDKRGKTSTAAVAASTRRGASS